jgi:1-acyl-sn-glycerol-3-phosphate acyltransferase
MTNDESMTKPEGRRRTVTPRSAFGFRNSFVIRHSLFVIAFHTVANRLAAVFMKLLFGYGARVHVLQRENANRSGGFLLASNHISHFDPFIISSVVRRKIDWMAMAEFFPLPIVGWFLRAVDAFPAARERADRATIRTAIERLGDGRIVGVFPEGGIRNGKASLLEGAPLRAGASTLAHIAAVRVLPCVILGSDRLYGLHRWLLPRRNPVWIAFGEPIPCCCDLPKPAARARIERELTAAFQKLYLELREKFQLAPDDLPRPPQERMKLPRHLHHEVHAEREEELIQNNSAALRDLRLLLGETTPYRMRRVAAQTVDVAMCASMNLLQMRHRLHARSREEMETYVAACEKMTPHEYYAARPDVDLVRACANGATISWRSPITTKFPANNTAFADFFACGNGSGAPTLLILHALLSATHIGYRRLAAHFNALGWNACFVHLPYHYSRKPRGYWNGELAITADLIRNAEGLRQGVMEVRQLIAALRACGSHDFGILGTSYGGWIGALLAMVERDLHFAALMCPIVNVEHAIWQSRASIFMRRELRRSNIEPALVARHFHLSSPMHNQPSCDPQRVLFVSGEFDLIARTADVEEIHQRWAGSELLRVRQGHFGYRMLRETVARLKERGLVASES